MQRDYTVGPLPVTGHARWHQVEVSWNRIRENILKKVFLGEVQRNTHIRTPSIRAFSLHRLWGRLPQDYRHHWP